MQEEVEGSTTAEADTMEEEDTTEAVEGDTVVEVEEDVRPLSLSDLRSRPDSCLRIRR